MPDNENEKLYQGAAIDPPKAVASSEYAYAELDVTTNFSFLRGASHPDELVFTSALLGQKAMAVTDVNSVAGVIRAYAAARDIENFHLIVGARLAFTDAPDVLVWASDREAYGRLCRLLTIGRRRAPKGQCHLSLDDFLDHHEGLLAALAPLEPCKDLKPLLRRLRNKLGNTFSLAASCNFAEDNEQRLARFASLSNSTFVPLVATNYVHYHHPGLRPLQDVLTCVRHRCTLHDAGHRLFPNAERYMKSPAQMQELFARYPQAIKRGLEIAEKCTFKLDELKYEYPDEVVPPGKTMDDHLRELTYAGAAKRYPAGLSAKVKKSLEEELVFIQKQGYASYFLTVHDLVRFAESKNILCQGRGSAANSAVCFCLGVTAIDPDHFELVFARFAGPERDEPPDIDIDFEHERREEVIQYVYEKYGRHRAAMTAVVIAYRGRSAVRDVGKTLGIGLDVLEGLAGKLDWWHRGTLSDSQLREAGVDPSEPTIRLLIDLTSQLLGFPRHLSQHVGGLVISQTPLSECVPIENCAMQDRTVIQWDKDDLDTIGMFKVDCLALGMLTALRKGLTLINAWRDSRLSPYQLRTIPHKDAAVFGMISDADTVGVFQVESRAQMSMLPRLRPERFFDLVIEVAIVRPGPIQGDMVHPYLIRREKWRKDRSYEGDYPKDELRDVLRETLGIPLFQEQAMRIAMVAAKFTSAEADGLRRAMATFKRTGGVGRYHDKFVNGMMTNGYDEPFAESCFKQIQGFGSYGFPESHAASFAILVYASAWIKRYHPAAFCAALLNSQPMGFYKPAQLVQDAIQHGVEVRPIDVNESEWDSTLEQPSVHGCAGASKKTWGFGGPALRIGFRQVKGISETHAKQIAEARLRHGRFACMRTFHLQTRLPAKPVRQLAEADAFGSMGLSRRQAVWHALELGDNEIPLVESISAFKPQPSDFLPFMPLGQEVLTDYATHGLSLKAHPVSLIRQELIRRHIVTAKELQDEIRSPAGRWVKVAGLVLIRQRPGTASGVVFISMEDETGTANLILWSDIYERYRPAARHAQLLLAEGYVQREGQVVHVLAKRLSDLSELLAGYSQRSRDFH